MHNADVSSTFKLMTTTLVAGVVAVAATLMVAGIALAPRQAEATAQFAQQTGKPCGQCHVSAAGGGKLKPFGERFKAKGNKL